MVIYIYIVIVEGAKFGCHVNENKSWTILKDKSNLEQTQNLLPTQQYGIYIYNLIERKHHSAEALGASSLREEYADHLVKEWC